jgi:hypothetical protein
MRFIEIPALITEDIEDPSIVDITEEISVSISGTTMTIDGDSKVSGEATITLTGDVNINAVSTSNLRTPSIHKITIKTNGTGNFTYVPNDTVTASSVSTTTKTGSDLEILLITTSGGDTYLDLDVADYTSPALYTSNALTGFNVSELTSTYGATAKLYKPDGTLLTTVNSATTGSGVNFGYTESLPGDVEYKLEVTDDLGRKSTYNLPRKWINYAMGTGTTPGFQKFRLEGTDDDYTTTVMFPSLGSSSTAKVYRTSDHGYMGINFKIQGRDDPSGAWTDIANADEDDEVLAFGDFLYHRVWVKPTAKATTTVSSSNVVTLTLTDFTEENVTTSFTGADPYDINESTNTYVFEETTKIGTVPFTVTLGGETYTNAVSATTEEISGIQTKTFHTDVVESNILYKHLNRANTAWQVSGSNDGNWLTYSDGSSHPQFYKGSPETGYTLIQTVSNGQGSTGTLSYDGLYHIGNNHNNVNATLPILKRTGDTFAAHSSDLTKHASVKYGPIAWSPNSYNFVVTDAENEKIYFYEFDSSDETWSTTWNSGSLTSTIGDLSWFGKMSARLSKDGEYLVTGDHSPSDTRIWKCDWTAQTVTLQHTQTGDSGAAAIDYNGEYVITGYDSANTKILKRSDTTWTDVTTSEGFTNLPYIVYGAQFLGVPSQYLLTGEYNTPGQTAGQAHTFMYKWRTSKSVTLAFANPTLSLTTSNVTISSAKLYRDDVLFHTYGTESNVVLRSDQTGTYQAVVNDVYYSNRVTPDFTTTRSVSAPQLEFDGSNRLNLSNITPTSTTLGVPDGTTRDLTTQSNVYIYEPGTYTANVQTSETFAYLSNVVTSQPSQNPTDVGPTFTFDEYNRLAISNITQTSSTLKYGSNTYDTNTASNVYVTDAGEYKLEARDANTFVMSNVYVGAVSQHPSDVVPTLTFDGYNKLTIDNVDTVETATIKKDGAAFATTTSDTVYIRDTGTYTAEVKGTRYGVSVNSTAPSVVNHINSWISDTGDYSTSGNRGTLRKPVHDTSNKTYSYYYYWEYNSNNDSYDFRRDNVLVYNYGDRKWYDGRNDYDPVYVMNGDATTYSGTYPTSSDANEQTISLWSGSNRLGVFNNPYYDASWVPPIYGVYAIELSKEVTGTVSQHPADVVPSLTYDNYNKITLNQLNYEDTATVSDPNGSIHEIGTAKTMYVKDTGEYVFKISGTDKYVESNVYVSSVDLAGATTKPIDFDGYNKLTLIDAGSNVSANVTYFSNTYELGSANVLYINGTGTYDLEMSGSNVFALSSNVVGTVSQHPTDVVPSLTFDNYNKLTLENFTTVSDKQWPPADGTLSSFTVTNSDKDAEWTISGASYGNGTYKAKYDKTIHGSHHPGQVFDRIENSTSGEFHSASGADRLGNLSIEFPESFVVDSYEFRDMDNSESGSGTYAPKDFTMQGSHDGSTWVTLDTQSGINTWATVPTQKFTVTGNSTAYKHYRISVSDTNGGNYLEIMEMRFYQRNTRTAKLTDPNGSTYALGQTQDAIYIKDQGDYFLEVTNSDQSAVVKKNIGTISTPTESATPSTVTVTIRSSSHTGTILKNYTIGPTTSTEGDNQHWTSASYYEVLYDTSTTPNKVKDKLSSTYTDRVTSWEWGTTKYQYEIFSNNYFYITLEWTQPVRYPRLTFDTYNKLSINNLTPTSSRLTYGSNTYDIGTASNVYIEHAGTYKFATGDATTFALVSNVVGTVSQHPTDVVPSLTYDTSNKLSIANLTPTSTTLTDPNGSSFDIGTASNVYIRDSGKYSIASKDANTFALASTTVTGTPTGTTYVYDSNTFTTPSQTYDTTKTITVKNVPSTLTDVAGKIYKGSTAYTIHATTSSSNVIIKNTGTYVSVFTTATQAFLTNAIGVTTQPTTTSDDNTIEDEGFIPGSTAVPDETTTDAPSVTLDATDTTVTDPTLDLDFTTQLPRNLKRYNGVTNSSIGARFNRRESRKKRIEKSISIPSSFSAELTANNASSPTTLTVTVANSKFVINGDETPTLGFIRGETYTFDQSDASNSGHPLVLVTSADGTTLYESGWTTTPSSDYIPGVSGAQGTFIVPYDVPDTIYYKCNVHPNMGGEIHTTFGNVFSLGDFTVAANTHVSGEYTLATNYDGTTSNLYVNGYLITQTTPSPAISAGVRDFILGKEFDGYVKNFKFWNYAKSFLQQAYATGGTITYITGYTVHTFTSSGNFVPEKGLDVEYLVVAGGGGGGGHNAGGGGAGGLLTNLGGTKMSITATSYAVVVGAGGVGGTNQQGSNGSNSSFNSIAPTGGGGGGSQTSPNEAQNGGSGGGAGVGGTTPGTGILGQGFGGGTGTGSSSYMFGGGGGSGAAGGNATSTTGGVGGVGRQINIDGNNYYWAAGGGGSAYTNGTAGNGGLGGGGGGSIRGTGSTAGSGGGSALNSGSDGVDSENGAGGDGGTNTGSGGGASHGGLNPGGAGGSGIVIIRYAS